MSRNTRSKRRKDQKQSVSKAPAKPPSLPEPPLKFPSLPECFGKGETREQIEHLAALKTKVQPRPDGSSVPTLPDEILLDRKKVESLLEDKLEDPEFYQEICEFPDHAGQIERLKIENELLKEQISFEKAKNAILHGEVSTFKELARRVLHSDKTEKTWDSRQEAFVRLVGGLLGVKSKDELQDENYHGHDIPREPLESLYLGRR